MSYRVIKNSQGLYDLVEKDSKNIIEISRSQEIHAQWMRNRLNLGSGFNGWTPNFVANSNLILRS